ncbi:hypothetical protein BurJ1DRAFT_0564 [Burkholderiales bacterium JOSHI_001]|nr:hypothetical protein BurJ1DRAFT_0564 [Burkholderiales bacterium JOSHI_001]
MAGDLSIEWRWVLVALATWRLTHLLAEEDGPFDAVVRLRQWVGDGLLGRAMDCFHCLSLWLAAPLALYVSREPGPWLMAWLAASGAAGLLHLATHPQDKAP